MIKIVVVNFSEIYAIQYCNSVCVYHVTMHGVSANVAVQYVRVLQEALTLSVWTTELVRYT